jgi:hypothetical protein
LRRVRDPDGAGSLSAAGVNEAPSHLWRISQLFPENLIPLNAINPIVQSFYMSVFSAIVCVCVCRGSGGAQTRHALTHAREGAVS